MKNGTRLDKLEAPPANTVIAVRSPSWIVIAPGDVEAGTASRPARTEPIPPGPPRIVLDCPAKMDWYTSEIRRTASTSRTALPA